MSTTKQRSMVHRSERGQSIVEVAISLPIIILLLVGTLDFGMAVFSFIILRDAAQEGALYASFDPNGEVEIENRARSINPQAAGSANYSPINLADTNQVRVDIQIIGDDCQGITDEGSNSIEVSVSYDYPLFMPFAEQVLGSNTIPLTASATNVILQPPCP
ncbi:MAG: TadE/TadG family type IV pilus assembly protein [Chloroflexota bacterium]